MANEVHQKVDVALADFDFDTDFADIDSLADGALAWSAPVATCEDCERVEVFAQIKVGTTPTKGGTIELYALRADDGGTEKRQGTDNVTLTDHGTNTDADQVYQLLGVAGSPLAAVVVDDETDTVYTARFNIWYPGADFNLLIYNNTGAAFNGTFQHLVSRCRLQPADLQQHRGGVQRNLKPA